MEGWLDIWTRSDRMAGFIVGFLIGGFVGIFLSCCISVGKISDLELEISILKKQKEKNKGGKKL